MLSVIVPAYNAGETIKQCLESIQASSYQDFELIVVDDGSTDETAQIAETFSGTVVKHPKNLGKSYARNLGIDQAKADILVFVDADVTLKKDSLKIIKGYFEAHPDVDGVTGLLSKDHPNSDYFSQYKNLYMNFVFSQLPNEVTFIYGSTYAVRKERMLEHPHGCNVVEDVNVGHKLTLEGRKIMLLKELDVIHLKRYDFLSWLRNDFMVPFAMARTFVTYKGWHRIGRKNTGYSHVSKDVLGSIMAVWLYLAAAFFDLQTVALSVLLAVLWAILNYSFITFLARERGKFFGLMAIPLTFLDHLVMGFGVLCGFANAGMTQVLRVDDEKDAGG